MTKKGILAAIIGVSAATAAVFGIRELIKETPGIPTDPTQPGPTPGQEFTINKLTINPKSGTAPLTVGFSLDIKGNWDLIEWNFGNNEVKLNTLTETARYFSAETYNGFVKITDSLGHSETRNFTITVSEESQPTPPPGGEDPSESDIISNFFQEKASIIKGQSVGFSIALAVPSSQIKEIRWKWGDGTPDLFGPGSQQNELVSVDHTYNSTGTKNGSVTVTLNDGTKESKSFSVIVDSDPTSEMTVKIILSEFFGSTIEVGEQFRVFIDKSGGVDPFIFKLDFDDGTVLFQQDAHHVYSAPGSYILTATVTDANGLQVSTSKTLNVETKEAQFGDISIKPISPGSFDRQWEIRNNRSDIGISINKITRLFDSNGNQVDSNIVGTFIDKSDIISHNYNFPGGLNGDYVLVLEVQDAVTNKLLADHSEKVSLNGSGDTGDSGDQVAERGSVVIIEKNLSQVDSNTVRMIVTVGNNNNFPINGTLELFPEFINPDGSIVNLADQIKSVPLNGNEKDRIFFQWDPFFGFELPSGGKLRVGVNYRDSNGNFLVSGQPTSQITIS